VHVVYPLAMGLNRGRYFLLTGEVIGAVEAKAVGLVNEVLPRDRLLPRAWELARTILRRPEIQRRYARILLTEKLRREMRDLLPYGLALEGLAMMQ
jgi:enoyl-CoA hydratase/carnithine racemase